MKVIVVSDTHRRNENYFKVLELHKPDLIIHCGHIEGSEYALESAAPCPVKMVTGNNDFFSELPHELDLTIEKYRVLVTHGHTYYVSTGPEYLAKEAQARGFDIVCYGHTHRPGVIRERGVVLVNPGSLSYPRQEGRKPSYCIMETDRFGEIHFTIAYLE